MKVLSTILEINVMVHRVDGTSTVQGFHEPIENYPMVHLSYHQGVHYNSVRRGDDPLDKDIKPVKDYPIGTDLNQIKNMLAGKQLDFEI